MSIELDQLKKYGWHLKVVGAYVQSPTPSIVGLDEETVIGSNDAASLYPISGAHQNLGYDTIRDRIYDITTVGKIVGLIEKVFSIRQRDPNIATQALSGFQGALGNMLRDFLKTSKGKAVNKKEATEFTLEYYPILLERILKFKGPLENIYNPTTDEEYYLLKSCLYPLLETIFWLSPQNKGYNQTAVDYVFFHDEYIKEQKGYFIFKEINSTRTTFGKLNYQEGKEWFQTRIINPYGVLYDLHANNLAYDVDITITSLKDRSAIKNQMLVLSAVLEQWTHLTPEMQDWFGSGAKFLSENQAEQILTAIKDSEDKEKRIKSLTAVGLFKVKDPKSFLLIRIVQLNIIQLGIKVSMNSGYGVFAMPTWVYGQPLIGNSFTCAGKIYGIKLFQSVSVEILENIKEKE